MCINTLHNKIKKKINKFVDNWEQTYRLRSGVLGSFSWFVRQRESQ